MYEYIICGKLVYNITYTWSSYDKLYNVPHYKRPQCNCAEVSTVEWELTKPVISNSGLISNLNMAMSSVALYFVLICAVCAANAWPMTVQQYHLQSLNRVVETAKAMYEMLAEEQVRAQYYHPHVVADKQQEFTMNEKQSEQQGPQLKQQRIPWETDQQAMEDEEEPNLGNPQFLAGFSPLPALLYYR